ncbi:hypothetical protein K504DRAFT_538778 [Pleomassaria siparia CBS 279.74]|uniref:Uncharacterized protein n=1 Tax=Pleomassaria siparia CBS 279.74 TaxID=1314801 RepID=A0A6G1JTV8_9PLEO|nr:hypothetical protein K504DRAFT_538778 [Pleomassaria siparia CBS 279.74]
MLTRSEATRPLDNINSHFSLTIFICHLHSQTRLLSVRMPPTRLQQHAEFLLRFPRELRDMIYPDIVKEELPVSVSNLVISGEEGHVKEPNARPPPTQHPIICPQKSHPIIAAEALEAFWQCNTFVLNFEALVASGRTLDARPKSHIRHLVVSAREEQINALYQGGNRVSCVEFECRHRSDPERRRWCELLTFPRLESLTINMIKRKRKRLCWMYFSPILHALREQQPGIKISFNVSFDEMLERDRNDPQWEAINGQPWGGEFESAGFIDVSDMFVPATREDWQYVDEYLPDRAMPTGRDIIRGLSTESPNQRRALGSLYFVSEPPLLRVQMDEHWKVYQEFEQGLHDEGSTAASL